MEMIVWILAGGLTGYITHAYLFPSKKGQFADVGLGALGGLEGGYMLASSSVETHMSYILGIVVAVCGAAFFLAVQRIFTHGPLGEFE